LSRQEWFDGQLDLDPAKLVFIDETGLSTKMARLRGRFLCGQRCRSAVPHGHWKTTTFTGALRLSGMTAPMVLDGPMNGAAFLAYVEQVLVPTLSSGDTVIMDNLPAHKADGVRQAIEAAGGRLLYLPPYSPDFNPIEMAFPNLKRFYVQEPSAPLTPCGIPWAKSSRSSNRRNVQTTSQQPDMTPIKMDVL
jgi:transposase